MSRKNLALNLDAIVIGSGIQGLLLAKRLVDYGQTVAILERASTIAKGSSSKNHGWLHQGTTHSLSAKDTAQAEMIARQLQYGHAFYKSYAPECFDEPILNSYAVTNDANRAEYARRRWQHSNVPFKELSAEEFFRLEPDINRSAVSYFFQVADSRINNRLLFSKLLTELTAKKALILTEANYEYLHDYELLVMAKQGEYTLNAPLFFYATGTGTEAAHQKLMHTSLGVECFKSQLLFMPKVSRHSVIDIDYSSPIIVNHGELSAVNRSHDDVVSDGTEPVVDEQEVERALSSLAALYPNAKKLRREQITAVACLKPCIPAQAN
ncbi:MAG TPA: FAD-dependent oxidoreductase, partial [Verrucomicrobiae bacterium]|nr:FAD-dependent oxidoreductase [Verrucomicrobiae bacterium]